MLGELRCFHGKPRIVDHDAEFRCTSLLRKRINSELLINIASIELPIGAKSRHSGSAKWNPESSNHVQTLSWIPGSASPHETRQQSLAPSKVIQDVHHKSHPNTRPRHAAPAWPQTYETEVTV
jgi:hypothetical protein